LALRIHLQTDAARSSAAHVLFFDLDGKMDVVKLLEVGSTCWVLVN